jgi:hypothetical protein
MTEANKPFSTEPSSSGNANGSSTTTGLSGTEQTLADGRVMIEASEKLTATRADGLDDSLTASCTRTQTGDVIVVEQRNYSYTGRELPPSKLYLNLSDFPPDLPD